jgi:hypothetical protein
MDSNLLKEAIADAKAVRQTALANAKAALTEAFGEQLSAMLAPTLEEDTMEQTPNGQDPLAQTQPPVPGMEQESVNEADIEEIIRELESGISQDQQDPTGMGANVPPPVPGAGAPPVPGAGAPPVPGAGAPPSPEMGMGAGAPPSPEMGMGAGAPPPVPGAGAPPMETPPVTPDATQGDEEMDEEFDINELLESLKDEDETCNLPPWEKKSDDDEEQLDEGVPVKSSGIAGSNNKMPSSDASASSHIESGGRDKVGGGEGYKAGPEDATTAKRPNQAKNANKTNLSTPGGALKENTGGSTPGYPEGAKKKSTGNDPSEVSDTPNAGPVTPEKMSTPALHKENVALKGQLKEAEDTLTYLRTQLNEINLLNAKLLYTNKLFKEYSMHNDKKMKIVEMFDLAKNVREVKMTYAVIAESLNFGADFKRKVSSKVQSITEGMASKPIAGTAPRQIIAESARSEMVSKFQRLAGIKTPSNK